jgi:hypothetical protein
MSNVINLDVAKRVDIICRKGDTFKLEIDLKDSTGAAVPSNAYTFKMEVRTADYANAAYSDSDATIVLSTEDTTTPSPKVIVPTVTTGKVVFVATNVVMRNVASGMYVYDIEAISTTAPNESQTWLYGTFKVNEDISV